MEWRRLLSAFLALAGVRFKAQLMMDNAKRIAIIGAGPAGLATAIYLKRAGHNVVVFDQFETVKPVGSGLLIQPTGLTVLNDLGIAHKLVALGQRIDRLHGVSAGTGRPVLAVDYDKTGKRFGVAVHRAALFGVLHEAASYDGVEIRTSVTVSAVSQDQYGAYLVKNGELDRGETWDLVVDTSGALSEIRTSIFPDQKRRSLQYGAFWATLDWTNPDNKSGGFREDALQQCYYKASVMIGILPIGRQRVGGKKKVAFFWSLKPEDVDVVKTKGLEAWKDDVRSYWPEVEPYLEQIKSFEDLTFAKYGHLTVKQPYHGRCVFVGDSAHSTSPQLGQGANMALLDARALAFALSRNDDFAEALKNYAVSRRLHLKLFQSLSLLLTPFYQSDSHLIPLLRDVLMSSVAKVPPMPSLLSHMVCGTLVDPYSKIGLQECDLTKILDTQITLSDGVAAK